MTTTAPRTRDTISPIRRLCPRTTRYTREIEGIDLKKKRVMVAAGFGSGQGDLEYDHLVVALGTVTDFRGPWPARSRVAFQGPG